MSFFMLSSNKIAFFKTELPYALFNGGVYDVPNINIGFIKNAMVQTLTLFVIIENIIDIV